MPVLSALQTIPMSAKSTDDRVKKDYAFFRKVLQSYLDQGDKGNWMVIAQAKVAGVFPTEMEALDHALETVESGDFIIQKIEAVKDSLVAFHHHVVVG